MICTVKLIIKPSAKTFNEVLQTRLVDFTFFPHFSFHTALCTSINKSRRLYQKASIGCLTVHYCSFGRLATWCTTHHHHRQASTQKASSGLLCKWLACSTPDHICSNINRTRIGFSIAMMFRVVWSTRRKKNWGLERVSCGEREDKKNHIAWRHRAQNLFSHWSFYAQPHLVVILQTSSRKPFYGQNAWTRQSNELRCDRFWGLPIKSSPLNKHWSLRLLYCAIQIVERQRQQLPCHKSFQSIAIVV